MSNVATGRRSITPRSKSGCNSLIFEYFMKHFENLKGFVKYLRAYMDILAISENYALFIYIIFIFYAQIVIIE